MSATSTALAAAPTSPVRRKWLAPAFLVIAQLMVVLDGKIVNAVMPAAQADLQFTDHDRQWIITVAKGIA